jgi:uncharacterized membrane protein
MSELVSEEGRFATAKSLVVVMVVVGLGTLAVVDRRAPLTDVLSKTIQTGGIDAAVAQYRTLRDQGFSGLRESKADTNRLGYELLAKRDPGGAIKVFQLNVETHPDSPNAYDSLGEAYLAAGDEASAIENYEKAVTIDPRKKSAVAALQRLTKHEGRPYPLPVLFHIGAGTLALLSGLLAMSLRKGSRWHGRVGNVFVASMMSMSVSGAYMAAVAPELVVINVLMGVFTLYLVATAWLAARRRNGGTGIVDQVALLVVLGVTVGFAKYGLESDSPPLFAVFGGLAFLAAVLDVRMIVRGGVVGAGRIARHLWRVSTALFVAVNSLFLGQPQVFPEALRGSGLLAVPGLLVIASLIFWLIRVLFTGAYRKAASPKPKRVVVQPALAQRAG